MHTGAAPGHSELPIQRAFTAKDGTSRPDLAFSRCVEIAGKKPLGRSLGYDPRQEKRFAMTRSLTAIAAAATLGLAAIAAPQQAEAHDGGAIAAGIIGGLAVGAIIGSAAAHGPYYYGRPAYYGPGPAYYGSGCYWTRQRVWDGYDWHMRRVRVCD
jgi:hypothetical protein